MELLINYSDLMNGLNMVTKAAKTSSVHPLIANVALITRNDRLYMKCNNMEFGIETYIVCDIIEHGEVTINANLLKSYIARLPKETNNIHFKLNKTNLRLLIEILGNEEEAVNISGLDISEFPISPINALSFSIKMPAKSLRDSINKVAYAAGTNEQYITTTGVRVVLTDGECSLGASDGTKLAYYTFTPTISLEQGKSCEMIVPAKALMEISSIVPNTIDEIVEIGVNPNRSYIIFKWTQSYCYINLIEGVFPKLENYISFNTETQILLKKKELEDKLTDINLFTKTEGDIVTIDIVHETDAADGYIKLFASSEMTADIHRQLHSDSVFGKQVQILASIKLLQEAVKSVQCEDIMMEYISAPYNQILFGPYSDEYKKHVAIVMPRFAN